MKVLVAPDSFKGSVTAKEAAEAMKQGIHQVSNQAEVVTVPLADGGEGTMTSLIEATGGLIHDAEVEDPLGRKVIAQYGVTGDHKTAVIELASASGLQRLSSEELDPAAASSYGTGQLISHALEGGLRSFIVCLGGSATNDAGTGLLKALGFRFLDQHGNDLSPGGLALKDIRMIDDSNVDPRAKESVFQIACDVHNPLTGTNGASAVFGPQKGADPDMADALDGALTVFAAYLEGRLGKPIDKLPGAGAAGGTSAGMYALLDAELKPGFEIVTEALRLKKQFEREHFDVIFTGEGKVDGQTASGKVISGIASLGKAYDVPTIALAGAVEGDLSELHERGLIAAFSIINEPTGLEQAVENAVTLIKGQAGQVFRLFSHSFQIQPMEPQ